MPIGINLSVTPKFLKDGNILFSVSARREFIENRAAEANFNNFTQTSKTKVSANAVMQFGQTLVLSGLSEKETEELKDGVPILQDIPGIQYFFSNETTLDFTKSVLILLTPRKPQYTFADGTPVIEDGQPEARDSIWLDQLSERTDWKFTPEPNLSAVMYHLKDSRFFREFRSGDVALESWEDVDSLSTRIKRVLEFIYY